MLSTCSWGPQLFRIFLSVHQQTSTLRAGRGQRWGSVLCTGWCKTGRSAWNHGPMTSWYVSRPKNASRGPSLIYYSLTEGPYIAKDLPVHLGDSLSFRTKKNILMCSVSCHWLECSIYSAMWLHRTFFYVKSMKQCHKFRKVRYFYVAILFFLAVFDLLRGFY